MEHIKFMNTSCNVANNPHAEIIKYSIKKDSHYATLKHFSTYMSEVINLLFPIRSRCPSVIATATLSNREVWKNTITQLAMEEKKKQAMVDIYSTFKRPLLSKLNFDRQLSSAHLAGSGRIWWAQLNAGYTDSSLQPVTPAAMHSSCCNDRRPKKVCAFKTGGERKFVLLRPEAKES
jgi:hypothetical protein